MFGVKASTATSFLTVALFAFSTIAVARSAIDMSSYSKLLVDYLSAALRILEHLLIHISSS